ncbi:hypothetical protein D3C78_1176240 [compost metagenome]
MHFTSSVIIPCRNAVPPPQLTRNAPVTYVFDPVQVNFLKTLWNELYAFPSLLRSDCRFGQRLHSYEPLCGQVRLYNGAAALAMTDLMHMVLDLYANSLLLKVLHELLAAIRAVQPLIRTRLGIHRTRFVHHDNLRQAVTLAYLEVIRIMRRRNFHCTGTKFLIYIFVSNNRNLASDYRQNDHLPDQMLISLILRMNSDCRIPQHRLGTSRSNRNEAGAVLKRIL